MGVSFMLTASDGRNNAGRIVGSGVYLIRMKTGAFVKTQKVAVVR
jgi:hypothetical protein